jgi:hypothetical protein
MRVSFCLDFQLRIPTFRFEKWHTIHQDLSVGRAHSCYSQRCKSSSVVTVFLFVSVSSFYLVTDLLESATSRKHTTSASHIRIYLASTSLAKTTHIQVWFLPNCAKLFLANFINARYQNILQPRWLISQVSSLKTASERFRKVYVYYWLH